MRKTQRAYYPFLRSVLGQSATAFAVAAPDAKLEALASLGQWLARPMHPALSIRQAWMADQVFSLMPGVAHVRVNPGYFADNYLRTHRRVIVNAWLLKAEPRPVGRYCLPAGLPASMSTGCACIRGAQW